MLRHTVFFSLLDGLDDAEIARFIDELSTLGRSIPSVRTIAVGRDISYRGAYQIALTVDFEDRKGLDAYMIDPAHKRIVDVVLPHFVRPHREVVDFMYDADDECA